MYISLHPCLVKKLMMGRNLSVKNLNKQVAHK